ncbi:MAG: glycosyltransferase family 2 protein [Parcubacteria group bacterium]|nr:glycosyltransferase family 2 protein [Parcubacteria group bacterium]
MRGKVNNNSIIKRVSFFCPAFNEEENLEQVIESVLPVLKEVSDDFEIIIIDNGSEDRTPQIADELARRIPEVRVIHHETNRQYGGALKSGFKNARNEVVVYMDSDNQYDFNDFKKMVPHLATHEVVIGYRKERHDSMYRLFQSKIFNTIIKLLFGVRVRDINCSFRAYKKTVLDNIDIYSNSGFIDAEMLIKAKNKGYSIFEVAVMHFFRKAGKSTEAKPFMVLITIKEVLFYWVELCILANIKKIFFI